MLDGPPLSTSLDSLLAIDEVCRAGELYPEGQINAWVLQSTISEGAEMRYDGIRYHHRPGSLSRWPSTAKARNSLRG